MRGFTLVIRVAAIGVALLAARAALAAPDCAPLGHLPDYNPGDQTTRAYETHDFTVAKDDGTENASIAGAYCAQSYTVKDGKDPASDLEIQSNYRDQLKKLGADLLFQDDRNTTAKLAKDGRETWVSVYSQETEIDVTVVAKAAHRQTLLPPSGKDYRLLGHMPNYVAGDPEKRNFDKVSFTVQEGDESKEIEARGARYSIAYTPKGEGVTASDIDIQTNYRNALQAAGAQIVFADGRNTTAHLESGGQSIWVSVYSQETEIDIKVIEEKAFIPTIKPPEAAALKSALDSTGHIALYVPFDFNKATLRPEAAPVIATVVNLLKGNPGLKIAIEGHTDNIGGHDYNMKLSEDRAAAVVAAVTAAGIAPDRLTARGEGPDKPVASNDTEEGRAKNRRVELVKA